MARLKPSRALIIFVAVLASLLEIIDTSIVNVALSTMMGNLGVTLEDISMVVTGYAIANAIILPVSAWLGERIGRRKYYLGCITLFTITSVACGFAPNLETLVIFRILQGLAGGALLPTSQTLIYEQFPKEQAGIAGAIFGMSVMIGPTLGPTLGGYLTDNFGWRSIFNVNLPLGIVALLLGAVCIFDRDSEEAREAAVENKKHPSLDGVGLALLVVGIGCLQYVLERGESQDWFSSTSIVICSTLAVLSLPAFVLWELRVEHPIINIRLFKDSVVVNGTLLMAMLGFFLFGLVFLLPVFVSRAFHYDATQVGMLFIPGSLVTALLMPFIGKSMQAGVNPKVLIGIGLVAIQLCLLSMTGFSPETSRDQILHSLYIRGVAMAFLFVPLNSSILGQFRGIALGQVSGLMNLFRQIGGSVGVAMVGTMLVKNSHQNYLDLQSHVTALNPAAQQAIGQSTAGMGTKMMDSVGFAESGSAALQALYGRVMSQVFMMSFLQLIYVIAIVMLFAFVPLYFLKLRTKVTKIAADH